jgi:putative thiamine transport system permease protein
LLVGAIAVGGAVLGAVAWLSSGLWRRWAAAGPTPLLTRGLVRLGDAAALLLLLLLLATLVVLGLWSVAGPWRFPDALPEAVRLELWWDRRAALLGHAATTLALALATSLLGAALVLLWLETSGRRRLPLWLWLPLVVPQIAFLFGLQVLLLALGFGPGLPAVILAHLLFVVPYTALLLADSWAGQDPRYAALARSLGHGRWSVFLRVKLPMLRGPVTLALAVGVAVSTALYLPTLFAGGGRVATLATEAVALAQGGDRRLAAATGVMLALLPLAALLAARRVGR